MKVIFDSSVLSAFARAELLDLLEQLTRGHERFVPRAVLDEAERGSRDHPNLEAIAQVPWLEVVPVDSLDELLAFARYAARLVAGDRNVGEASVLAWAEVHRAVAVIDDQDAVQCGRENQVAVRRSLALLASGIRDGLLGEEEAIKVVAALAERGEARFPCQGQEFLAWAHAHGLL